MAKNERSFIHGMKVRHILVFSICIAVGLILFTENITPRKIQSNTAIRSAVIQQTQFFNASLFQAGINLQKETKSIDLVPVYGIVMPHHLNASPLLSRAWTALSKSSPRCLVLIGPNHAERGDSPFQTGHGVWSTPFGKVTSYTDGVSVLLKHPLFSENVSVISEDQSLMGLLPYASYYTSETPVVLVLVSRKARKVELESVAKLISAKSGINACIMVASVDFSHNTAESVARYSDYVVSSMITPDRYDELLAQKSSAVDSPGSLVLLDMIMRKKTGVVPYIAQRSSSIVLSGGQDRLPAVGYVVLLYTRP